MHYVNKEYFPKVTARVQKMLAKHVIEGAPTTAQCCFSLFVVPKKNAEGIKTDVRPCLDLRLLNLRLKDIECPQLKIQDIINAIGSAKGCNLFYTILDVKDSYFRSRFSP